MTKEELNRSIRDYGINDDYTRCMRDQWLASLRLCDALGIDC